jgi:hypothetical protein
VVSAPSQPYWHAYTRFDEQDVLRFFAEREARLAPAAPPDPAGEDRRGAGGAPRKYPWDELGAAFGAWLHQEPGRDRLPASKHLDALAEIAGELRARCRTGTRPPLPESLARGLPGLRRGSRPS